MEQDMSRHPVSYNIKIMFSSVFLYFCGDERICTSYFDVKRLGFHGTHPQRDCLAPMLKTLMMGIFLGDVCYHFIRHFNIWGRSGIHLWSLLHDFGIWSYTSNDKRWKLTIIQWSAMIFRTSFGCRHSSYSSALLLLSLAHWCLIASSPLLQRCHGSETIWEESDSDIRNDPN